MMRWLVEVITASAKAGRDQPLEDFCRGLSAGELLHQCDRLESFHRESPNLYHRVRALSFLSAIYQYHLPPHLGDDVRPIPADGASRLLQRDFDHAIQSFLRERKRVGIDDFLASALAEAYRGLAFQTLADQVRESVRAVKGNAWMFAIHRPEQQTLRLHPELFPASAGAAAPILRESTAVRMDFSHSAWSDIFFLGMDFPQGARVLNASIDLAIRGRDEQTRPPIQTSLQLIEEPCLRLVSRDLRAQTDVRSVEEVFDFARDYLGLLKAAVISAGIVPPGLDGTRADIREVLQPLVGPGRGLELVSDVRGIPKGSRLAVSTSLLASLIALGMRATAQTRRLDGVLEEEERRLVAARAILGEWLGGSGGGWQDSGGIWPGFKLIEGAVAAPGDPEYGISHGRLLPRHQLLGKGELHEQAARRLQESLILVHGGLSQDVGPILEMVTERYLLRSQPEWDARQDAVALMDQVLAALSRGDVKRLGQLTAANFTGPIQTIIPWASNAYTEHLIQSMQEQFGSRFWGFWMLGGMSGGGMGFLVDPSVKSSAQTALQRIMTQAKERWSDALPFAMDPVVYDFAINERGTEAIWEAPEVNAEAGVDRSALAHREFPASESKSSPEEFSRWLEEWGFVREQHEQVRAQLRAGEIGLAQNRLPAGTPIEAPGDGDVLDLSHAEASRWRRRGEQALAAGEVAVMTLAAGVGSRWTEGAGVVKALHPFVRMAGQHRSFLEVHFAKSRQIGQRYGVLPPHIVTTSYRTHDPIEAYLRRYPDRVQPVPVFLSPGRAIGLRFVPTERDFRFEWEETRQQRLDEQAEKIRESQRAAWRQWAKTAGPASDYTDNHVLQCLHPVGHWYEWPSVLRNGVLRQMLEKYPAVKTLMLHNVDTVGADLDPTLLGMHLQRENTLTFEVMGRRWSDRGGGLARVNGRLRLVEGLALPSPDDEFRLSLLQHHDDVDRRRPTPGAVWVDAVRPRRCRQSRSPESPKLPPGFLRISP